MIKVMVVSFSLIGIHAGPGIGCGIRKGNCYQGIEISPRLHNSGYPKTYP